MSINSRAGKRDFHVAEAAAERLNRFDFSAIVWAHGHSHGLWHGCGGLSAQGRPPVPCKTVPDTWVLGRGSRPCSSPVVVGLQTLCVAHLISIGLYHQCLCDCSQIGHTRTAAHCLVLTSTHAQTLAPIDAARVSPVSHETLL